jgi:polyisoprenoid-binding protein YceI
VFQVDFLDLVKSVAKDKNSEMVVYGSSNDSMDAQVAMEKLLTAGYSQVFLLDGGLEAWAEAGFALEGNAITEDLDPGKVLRLKDGNYPVDISQSSLKWIGRNATTTHFGHVQLSDATLQVEKSSIKGVFTLDMKTISNENLKGDKLHPVLIEHLKSDDFFFTRLHPHARFRITGSRLLEKPFLSLPNYMIEGELLLRGKTAGFDFPATISLNKKGCLLAEAHFDLDRTNWGIIYGSARFFEFLGMHLVYDLISLEVRIVTGPGQALTP